MAIKSTKEYDKFSYYKGNRRVNSAHLKSLVVSISKRNLLEHNPILVNEKNVVIDGQHRLEAARELGIPIYYVVVKSGTMGDVQLLNSAIKAWNVEDHMKSFLSAGFEEYRKLNKYRLKYNVPVSTAMKYLIDEPIGRNQLMQKFREGRFEVTAMKKGIEMAEKIEDFRQFVEENCYRDRNLFRAVEMINGEVSIAYSDLIKRMKKNNETRPLIKRQATARDYLREFEDLYNLHLHDKQRFF